MSQRTLNSTGNKGRFLIVDNDGNPLTSVVYNTAGLALSVILQNGTEAAITLAAASDLLNRGKGIYEVAVPNSAYENLGDLTLCGVITDGAVVGFPQQVIAAPYTPAEIVRGIITGTVPNGSLARFVRDIKMADVLFEGQIVTAAAQTATLDAGATSVCFGQAITIGEEGDVDRQTRFIVGFDPATKVITLDMPWCVIPPNGRDYSIKVLRNALAGDLDKSRAGSYGAGIADTKADTTAIISDIEDATDEVLAALQGSTVIQVASPNVSGNLVLTQGDTYDGIGNPKAQWNVTTDYTSGWAVVLTIRDKDDAVIYTNTGTVVSATLISVTIVVPTVTPFEGCPGQWQGKFDVQLTKASSVVTIAIGVVYINEDQTR
jgi:hypothetical protein